MKILWVEDEAKDQLLELMGPVWMAGHFIDIAETKMEALEKIKKNKYDIYIFDLIIREGNVVDVSKREFSTDIIHGLELIKEIFNKNSEFNIDPNKCAVFSVVGKKDVHDKIREIGINKIIVKKEMSRTKLKEIIDSIIGNGGQESDM